MKRSSRSLGRRSSILKVDWNKDDDTGIIGNRNKRASRRVSFAETYQVKEFPKDSPRRWKDASDSENEENQPSAKPPAAASSITGLDKLLTGAIQTPYQEILSECPLPEVSVDSFNIFDPNNTMLDMVDMDTTHAAGSIELPQMVFPSEPSGEIKIDQGAFLKTLTDNSNSIKPIYSPKRDLQASSFVSHMQSSFTVDRSPLKGLPVQSLSSFNYQDKENIIVHTEMLPNYQTTEEHDLSQPLYDVKKFFSNLFGSDAQSSRSQEDEKTPTAGQLELTKIFGDAADNEAVEETKCLGGILAQGEGNLVAKPESDVTVNFSIPMEETKALGGLINKTLTENVINDPSDNQTIAMEETKVIGGILDKTSATSVILAKSDQTVNIPIEMEETKPLGGFMEKTFSANFAEVVESDDKTVAMEETRPIGGILDKMSLTLSSIKTTKSNESMNVSRLAGKLTNKYSDTSETVPSSNETVTMQSQSVFQSAGGILDETSRAEKTMEETKTVGGLLNKTREKCLDQSVHMTCAMEETKAVGGILDKTCEPENDKGGVSLYQPVTMEETQAIGGIMDSSMQCVTETKQNDKTVAMEETKAVGGILHDTSQSGHDKDAYSLYQTVAMEETRPLGGITDQSFQHVAETTRLEEKTMAMEETSAVGGILINDTSIGTHPPVGLDTQPDFNTDSSAANKADLTKNITIAMEETKVLGGILKQDTKTVDRTDILLSWGTEKTVNVNDAMEETKPVGGFLNNLSEKELIHSKSSDKNIEEKTLTFERFQNDWTASQLLRNRSINKATDLAQSNNKSHFNFDKHQTEKSTDAEANAGTAQSVTVDNWDKDFNRSVAEIQGMEETDLVSKPMDYEAEEYVVDEDITFKKTSLDIEEMDLTNCADVSLRTVPESNAQEKMDVSKVESPAVTAEVGVSHKRSFQEIRDSPVMEVEKTRDLTQSQMQLAKLKEMLINSKKKTAAQLRAGDMRTPSKLLQSTSSSDSSSRSSTRELLAASTGSPAHKKQRLHSEVQDTNSPSPLNTSVATLPAVESTLIHGATDVTGIDDEQMPDSMKHEMETFLSANETTRSDHSANETTRSDHTRSTESASSENKTSTSINISVVSNKSFASSFNIPDGPLSLESFYALTTRPPSKVSRGRCSTVFAPKLDMEDLEEVFGALLTLKPLVEAKKLTENCQQQTINENVETAQWLEKTLEETQPQIFQECAVASADELQEIRDRLKTLIRCCYNEAQAIWKEETGKMVGEALASIQADGCEKAESILEDVRSNIQSADQLSESLDTELGELDNMEAQLLELHAKQETMTRDHKGCMREVEDKRSSVTRLECDLLGQEQSADVQKQRHDVRQQVLAQLQCVHWNLDELTDDFVVFTFNQEHLELHIDYLPDTRDCAIKNISFCAKKTTDRLTQWEEMAQHIAVQAVDTRSLLHQYPSFSCMSQILDEVSETIKEVNQFCKEVKSACFRHKLSILKNNIDVELWNTETLDLVKVALSFDSVHPLSQRVSAKVQITIGGLMPDMIESRLSSVNPGQNYLSRLIEAVDFKELHR